MPFLNIFETKTLIDFSAFPLKSISIDDVELSRLKKTSVDYTLCDDSDKPLVCIDFDGYQEGYNVGTKYHFRTATNGWKEIIYDLKLKVAHGSLFPYFVLSSKEFADLSSDICLTIVDGIIGEVFAKKATSAKLSETFNPEEIGFTQEQFDEIDPSTQHELIQDWVFGVEIEMDFEHNPIHRKTAELSMELGSPSHNFEFIYPPEVDKARNYKERARLLDSALYQGAKVTIDSPSFGKIVAGVKIPNFKTPYFSGLGLAEEIAHFLALQKLRRRMKKNDGCP